MSYVAPYIDSTGLHIPSYTDIKEDLIDKVKTIYGQDIYLGNDSLDYQFISIFADKIYDVIQMLQVVYNGRSPVTAVGTNLDTIVKLNGLQRQPTDLNNAFSIIVLTITGAAGTIFSNLIVEDSEGYRWSQNSSLTIGGGGTVTGYFTCNTIGAITPAANTVTKIINPTIGVYSVTNTSGNYSTGIDVESDASLRMRQSQSVASAGQAVTGSTLSQIFGIPGVTKAVLYENDTGSTDANGIPAHSICAVVVGGLDGSVADAIYRTKTPGCGTYGATSETISSPYGATTTIYFDRPTENEVEVTVSVSAVGNNTITSTDEDNIEKAVENYINNLDIGAPVINSMLYYAVLTAQDDPANPHFKVNSVTTIVDGVSQGTNDYTTDFNALAVFDSCTVTVI